MYYLQSRYYDPELGRFLNADAYASTGQGIIGNNMFAYCNNSPVMLYDDSGAVPTSSAYSDKICLDDKWASGYGGGGTGEALLLTGLIDVVDEAAAGVALAVSYAYRQYTRIIKKYTEGLLPGNYPVTHHIIPYGDFSVRSKSVKDQLHEVQQIMKDAGVHPETDRINQLTLSVTYHMSLHTDSYIMMVTAPIIALGDNPDPDEIYAVLFDLRIIIAGGDQYAWGY